MRRHLSHPATWLSLLALLLAMSGTAIAAKHYLIVSTRQISPRVLKTLRGRTGKQGPQGRPGLIGAPGPAGANATNGVNGVDGKSFQFKRQITVSGDGSPTDGGSALLNAVTAAAAAAPASYLITLEP